MKGLYRGFCRNENGTETIVLNGEKIKGDWIYGGLYVNSIIYDIKSTHLIMETIDGFGMIEPPMAKPYEIIPETVCEAVRGVTDINGKQIFEGDVIDDNYSTWEVKYNYEHSGFGAYFLDCEQRKISEEMAKRFEIIGTIFDEKFEQSIETYHFRKKCGRLKI
jgi:hypothetical protein